MVPAGKRRNNPYKNQYKTVGQPQELSGIFFDAGGLLPDSKAAETRFRAAAQDCPAPGAKEQPFPAPAPCRFRSPPIPAPAEAILKHPGGEIPGRERSPVRGAQGRFGTGFAWIFVQDALLFYQFKLKHCDFD